MARSRGICPFPLVALAAALACGSPTDDPGFPGARFAPLACLELTLEDALRTGNADGRRASWDVTIELTRREGKVDSTGWAWFAGMPGLEHPAQATVTRSDPSRVELSLEVHFRDYPFAFAGGVGRYAVRIRPAFERLHGAYTGTVEAHSAEEAKPPSSTGSPKAAPGALAMTRVLGSDMAMDYDVGEARYAKVQEAAVTGRAYPLGVAPDGFVPPAAGEHPRLLLRASELPPLVSKARMARVAAIARGLRERLPRDGRPAAPASSTDVCDGHAAAGWAFLSLVAKRRGDANQAEAAARRVVRSISERRHDPVLARDLAALALSYDCGYATWQLPLREEVAAVLRREARRLCGMDPVDAADAILGADRLAGAPRGPADYRLAALRAAAGIAWFAAGNDGDPDSAADGEAVIQIARRSAVRLMREGIGAYGAGNGSPGFCDLLCVLLPYLESHRLNTGIDLTHGTGVPRVCVLAAFAGELYFPREAGASWRPFSVPFAPDADRPLVLERLLGDAEKCGDPWEAIGAVLAFPAGHEDAPRQGAGFVQALTGGSTIPAGRTATAATVSARPDDGRPRVFADERMGLFALRSGWDGATDLLTVIEAGSASEEAAQRRGDFAVFGMGRSWVCRSGGESAWCFARPVWQRRNGFSAVTDSDQAVVPACPGSIARVQVSRDGSGSLCVRTDARATADRNGAGPRPAFEMLPSEPPARPVPIGGSEWRTVGVDYSGASGARALVVVVEGNAGLTSCRRSWEIDVGSVPADCVTVGAHEFLVCPPGASATLKGTFLYPDAIRLSYVSPSGAAGGRIRAELGVRRPNADLSIETRLDHEVLGPPVRELDVQTAEERRRRETERERRLTDLGIMDELLRRNTRVTAGEDLATRVRSHCVVILTLQDGPPPQVVSAQSPGGFLARAGGQTVYYREDLIEFEVKRATASPESWR